MSDGGPPLGMSFPHKVHTEDEDFVIDLNDENMSSPPDGYGMDDRGRCKRRKRCGQCGPCQVKENCMKCHFCIRKDVLKQTCIYRKCVYLRSKPKPYSRPHQSPQGAGHMSPPRELTSPTIKSPPLTGHHASMSFTDPSMQMPDPRPDNPFFPPHLPHQQQQQQMGSLQNNGYVSPPNPMMDRPQSLPMMDRPQSLPGPSSVGGVNMNMQMNMSQQVQNHPTSPPVQKLSDHTSPGPLPQLVNSPPGIAQISSCNNIPSMPSITPLVPAIPTVHPSITNSSLGGMPNIPPTIPPMHGINDRGLNEFRHPDQLQLHPHHHHPHFPSVPPVHPHAHMPHRDTMFADHSRVPHMNLSMNPTMDSLSRGPNDSSCMYHPGLPYSMPGHFQPSGPSFLSGAADPFRSNFFNTFPPGYSLPPDRYRESFGPLPFSRIGMSAPSFPQYPSQGSGYGMGNTFPQQYAYNSQHGCPKNGSRPPVSPNTDDVKVLQEGYNIHENKTIPRSSSRSEVSDVLQEGRDSSRSSKTTKHRTDVCDMNNDLNILKSMYGSGGQYDPYNQKSISNWGELSPREENSRLWHDFHPNRSFDRRHSGNSPRSSSRSSSRSSLWEPWRLPIWYSPRRDDARSRTSTISSDFECEISIDDQPVNALVRSDGCNSIEIEFDNRSVSGSEDLSPRKSANSSFSDFQSPLRTIGFRPIEKAQGYNRSLFSPYEEKDKCPITVHRNENLINNINTVGADFTAGKEGESNKQIVNSDTNDPPSKKSTVYFKVPVCIKQDLGDEGIMQLELPGHKVSIEDIVLNDELLKQSSNVEELKDFLKKKQDIKVVQQKEMVMFE